MFEPNKDLGQNFLNDPNVVETMISQLNIGHDEEIIEIGAGLGAVTDKLVDRIGDSTNRLITVELDERFIPRMENLFELERNVKIVKEDILNWLPKYEPESPDQITKIIGSLPFYITSPIIHTIIKMEVLPKIVVLLIQKEVAERISAVAPDASYMSSYIQTFFDVIFVEDVPRNKFNPVPNVDGGIVTFRAKDINVDFDIKRKYEGFLHRAYSNPRKMLNKIFSKAELEIVGINPDLRAQNISPDKWYDAFNKLCF